MNPSAGGPGRLLMLAHRMPCSEGDDAQRRAWAWLQAANSRFEVWLMVLADQRINLSQWQDLKPRAARLNLVSSGEMRAKVVLWCQEQSFAACLCTAPGLWPRVESLSVGYHIVDIAASKPIRHRGLAYRLAIWRSGLRVAQRAAANCHRLVLLHESDLVSFSQARAWTKLMPTCDASAMNLVLKEAASPCPASLATTWSGSAAMRRAA